MYHFNLVCPYCGKESETETENRMPSPHVNCGDCLMDRTEVVELKVVKVTELKPVTMDDVLSKMKKRAPRRSKRIENAIDKRVERAYYATCSGIQIDVMDIGKVFEHGRRQIVTEGLDDVALAKSIREYVETIRKN